MLALELRQLVDKIKSGQVETRAKKLAEHLKNLARATAMEGGEYVSYKLKNQYWSTVDAELASQLLVKEKFGVELQPPQITLQNPEWDVVGTLRISW